MSYGARSGHSYGNNKRKRNSKVQSFHAKNPQAAIRISATLEKKGFTTTILNIEPYGYDVWAKKI